MRNDYTKTGRHANEEELLEDLKKIQKEGVPFSVSSKSITLRHNNITAHALGYFFESGGFVLRFLRPCNNPRIKESFS